HFRRGDQAQLVAVPLHRQPQRRTFSEELVGLLEALPGEVDGRAQLFDAQALAGAGPQDANDVRRLGDTHRLFISCQRVVTVVVSATLLRLGLNDYAVTSASPRRGEPVQTSRIPRADGS